ncbi:hypothetical protein HZA85_00770 [Candidatus Uhrbacteria bacterium]|nr:hypothetical protein [Candidatus Uhrbacteria bacterium]
MNRNSTGVIIVLIIVVAGGWYFLSDTKVKAPDTQTPTTNQMPVIGSTTTEMVVETAPSNATVAYTEQGFSPKSIAVTLGTSVTFVNQSSGGMWVASAAHPTHIVYSGTSLSQHCPDTTSSAFDACAAVASGDSFSFTFNKEGAWKYHNHMDASQTGVVIVIAPTPTPI